MEKPAEDLLNSASYSVFLLNLAITPVQWKKVGGTEIRCSPRGAKLKSYCPLTAVALMKTGASYHTGSYLQAGDRIDISRELSEMIADAADGPMSALSHAKRKIRHDLLMVTGLSRAKKS